MRKEDCRFVVSLGYIDPALNKWTTTTAIFFTFCKKEKKLRGKAPSIPSNPPTPSWGWTMLIFSGILPSPPCCPSLKVNSPRADRTTLQPSLYTLCARLLGGAMVDRKEEAWSWIGDARYWVCGTGGVWVESSVPKEASEQQQEAGWVSLLQVNFCTVILLFVTQGSES